MAKEIHWFYGATGTGKTHFAFEENPDAWVSSANLNWFDGYDGQETVIFDDFRKEHCSFSWFLRLIDKYPLRVPIKGGFVDWVPKKIIVTCCRKPEDEFFNHDTKQVYEDIGQVLRRIDKVTEFIGRRLECKQTEYQTVFNE